MSRENISKVIARIMGASGCKNQSELADFVGTSQPAVARAIKDGKAPDHWLYRIAYRTGRRVEWLQSGHGTEFQDLAAEEMERYRRELPPALHDLAGQWRALPEPERAIVDNALTLLLSSDADTRALMVDVLRALVEHRKRSATKG
jgi:hypothetical protein